MNGITHIHKRLLQLLDIVQKEAVHLVAVNQRLQAIMPTTIEQLESALNNDPILIDTLESFSAKFSRMQDTIADKLLPAFLQAAGEKNGTVIENLNRAEKLALISNTQQWLIARNLRNKLVHEYITDIRELQEAIELAKAFVTELYNTYKNIEIYACKQLKISVK